MTAQCQHAHIRTWVLEDGTPGMWSCVECGHKFVPLDLSAGRLLDAARNLRDVKGRHHSEQAYKRLMDVLAEMEAV